MKKLCAAFIIGMATLAAPAMADEALDDTTTDTTVEVRPRGQRVQCNATAHRGFMHVSTYVGASSYFRPGSWPALENARREAMKNAMRMCRQAHFRDQMVTCNVNPDKCLVFQ